MSEEADKDKKDDKYATFDSQFRCITLNTLVELIDTYQNTIFKKQEEDLNLIKIKKDKSIVNAAEMEEKIKKESEIKLKADTNAKEEAKRKTDLETTAKGNLPKIKRIGKSSQQKKEDEENDKINNIVIAIEMNEIENETLLQKGWVALTKALNVNNSFSEARAAAEAATHLSYMELVAKGFYNLALIPLYLSAMPFVALQQIYYQGMRGIDAIKLAINNTRTNHSKNKSRNNNSKNKSNYDDILLPFVIETVLSESNNSNNSNNNSNNDSDNDSDNNESTPNISKKHDLLISSAVLAIFYNMFNR